MFVLKGPVCKIAGPFEKKKTRPNKTNLELLGGGVSGGKKEGVDVLPDSHWLAACVLLLLDL